jgi:Ca2+/Na+ antiporter
MAKMPLLGLLLQLPAPPSSGGAVAYIWWVVALLFLVACALIVLLSRKREDVQQTNEKRATAAEGLVKTRDTELGDCRKEVEKLKEDKADVESEYKTLAGINIHELARFWSEKERVEADLAFAQSENRRQAAVIRRYEERDAGK